MKLNKYTFDYLQELLIEMKPDDLLDCYTSLSQGMAAYGLWLKSYIEEGGEVEPELRQMLTTVETIDLSILRFQVLDRMY